MRTFPLLIHPSCCMLQSHCLSGRCASTGGGFNMLFLSPKIRHLFPCVLLWTLAMAPAAMAKSRPAQGGLLHITLAVWSRLQPAAGPCCGGGRKLGSTSKVSVPAWWCCFTPWGTWIFFILISWNIFCPAPFFLCTKFQGKCPPPWTSDSRMSVFSSCLLVSLVWLFPGACDNRQSKLLNLSAPTWPHAELPGDLLSLCRCSQSSTAGRQREPANRATCCTSSPGPVVQQKTLYKGSEM